MSGVPLEVTTFQVITHSPPSLYQQRSTDRAFEQPAAQRFIRSPLCSKTNMPSPAGFIYLQTLDSLPAVRKAAAGNLSTLNPQPSTLNPQPSTLSPQPSTLNPQPSTIFPAPYTSKNKPTPPLPFQRPYPLQGYLAHEKSPPSSGPS